MPDGEVVEVGEEEGEDTPEVEERMDEGAAAEQPQHSNSQNP